MPANAMSAIYTTLLSFTKSICFLCLFVRFCCAGFDSETEKNGGRVNCLACIFLSTVMGIRWHFYIIDRV